MALSKAAGHVRGDDCTCPDNRPVNKQLWDTTRQLHQRLRDAGIPARTRKKVATRFKKWARDQDGRFPTDALDVLASDVPVDLDGTPVWDLPCLTKKQARSLMSRNLQTYGDVLGADKWDLLQVPFIGKNTVQALDRLQRADLA
ncbi:hypothetical protein [Salinibacter ruber]|uniref:RNA polymerase alpha subunit C-terminal domain-containing protein n=1 Tax=Salinibacter ruber TaxID=146919 RepID=A0AAW5P842_9BACT|nr:hypothetical protein [Salinibacter ruber]MCS4157808.1 hypothetical protein [Salinibacter ruber]